MDHRFGLALLRFYGCLLALLAGALWHAPRVSAAERPNVLLILLDDVGIGDLRPYNPAGRVSLPAIEQLAAEGFVFTDAHTSTAKCAPSRYSILTGNYQWRGLKPWGQWNYKGGSQILPGQETLGDLLRKAGFATAIVGKYHLGGELYARNSDDFASGSSADDAVDFARPIEQGANQKGFDYSFLALRGIQESPYAFFENDRLVGSVDELIHWASGDYGSTGIELPGIGTSSWSTDGVGPALLAKALAYLDSHFASGAAQPFFLYYNAEAAHSPHKPPASLAGRNVQGASGLSARGDMLVEADVVVEQLLAVLERHGAAESTLVVLTSDNGAARLGRETSQGHDANAGLRGDKGTIYEGGHRVPLIVKWPTTLPSSPHPPGARVDGLVAVQDLYATFAELLELPLAADQARDSVSLLPLINGDASSRDGMVFEADAPEDDAPDGIEGRHFAYRSGTLKMVFDAARRPVGLYDLAADLYERSNLLHASTHAEHVGRMQEALAVALASERTAPVREEEDPPPEPARVAAACVAAARVAAAGIGATRSRAAQPAAGRFAAPGGGAARSFTTPGGTSGFRRWRRRGARALTARAARAGRAGWRQAAGR